ncbi:MAG TPA: glucuronate isomerase [Oscillospiraceae bacterium]|nr:glucuronate isomerase [Oscillospiraceae bacterium]HPS34661.1 glucuronate isomerase [Oscillospiraceae bacterium]
MGFLNNQFLLNTNRSQELYRCFASAMPIFDFHCHIEAKELAENKPYENITRLWLGGDHYKWRAMRINGVDEDLITGKADDFTKFQAWADTIQHAIGNPLYHWTHLELARYFDIDYPLTVSNCEYVYRECSERLQTPDMLPQNIVSRSNVVAICTTDDPADDLRYHAVLAKSDFDTKVLPTFRPDRAAQIDKPGFRDYIEKLSAISGVKINNFTGLCDALSKRADFFEANSCKSSDISLEIPDFNPIGADTAIQIVLSGGELTAEQAMNFRSGLYLFLGELYHKKNWVMQLHIGALRSASTALLSRIGPNTGFDAVDDYSYIRPLAAYLNTLQNAGHLPKTILYNLNGKDTQALAALAATFCGDGIPGKVQYGAAWWFLDTLEGNREQLKKLSGLYLLPRFIGMLTDSRSLLSYTRHEYFRRILCGMLGEQMENGLIPNDLKYIGKIIQDISFNNAYSFFGLA